MATNAVDVQRRACANGLLVINDEVSAPSSAQARALIAAICAAPVVARATARWDGYREFQRPQAHARLVRALHVVIQPAAR
jgi:hypothetical protein